MEAIDTIKNIEAGIEAILFAAGHPVTYEKLSAVLGIGVRDVKRIVGKMAEAYVTEGNSHGILLLTFEDSCQFCTKEVYAPYIREALDIRRGGNLSASTMEALAVVAYNQPITRSYIDIIRGVDSNYAVNSLIDKELIEAVGRLDAPGRPMLYGTTEKFLRVFGLKDISDLPKTDFTSLKPSAEQLEAIGGGEQLSIDLPKGEEESGDPSASLPEETDDNMDDGAPTPE